MKLGSMPLLSEREHEYHLKKFLDVIRSHKALGEPSSHLEGLIPYIMDDISIARSVGYGRLADKYEILFRNEGLDVQHF